MDRDEIVGLLKSHYPALSKEYGVSELALFGSVAKGTISENSDVDILVEFDRPIGLGYIRLVACLEDLFGRRVDLLTKEGLENIRVKSISKSIKEELLYV